MAKKKNNLTLEEKLQNALVPKEEQPYQILDNWVWTYLLEGFGECKDKYRRPVNAKERESREGVVPYYGATGQVGWIDDYLTNEHLVLVGEDGAPFFELLKDKAYTIEGKAWINNHVHIVKSFYGVKGNEYLKHYLNIFNYNGYVNGTTRLKLTQSRLREIPIPLSPIQEQQRIVERIESLFSKLDEAKEKTQMSLDSFETRKSAILYQAFSGELTKKWREENGLRLDDWNNGTLQSVCSIKITDGTHQTPKYTSEENGIPFLSSKDIVTGKIKWDKIKYITEELHEELYKRVAPQKEDLLLAKNGTTGIAAIVEDDKIFDIYVTLALLRADYKKVFYRFLYYLINSPICKEQFNSKLTGIGVPNLHLRDIRNVEIAYPSLEEQKEIVRILDTIFEKEQDTQELIDLIEKIDLMKKSILARAFRGELGTNLPEEESAIELLKSILEEQ